MTNIEKATALYLDKSISAASVIAVIAELIEGKQTCTTIAKIHDMTRQNVSLIKHKYIEVK